MINNKSFNRVIAESLFNLANNNQTVISQTPGLDKDIFSATFDTVDSTIPESQGFIGDGFTTEYTLNGVPARSDLIDVFVENVLQRPGEVYDVQDDTLIFTETPSLVMDIYIKFR